MIIKRVGLGIPMRVAMCAGAMMSAMPVRPEKMALPNNPYFKRVFMCDLQGDGLA